MKQTASIQHALMYLSKELRALDTLLGLALAIGWVIFMGHCIVGLIRYVF